MVETFGFPKLDRDQLPAELRDLWDKSVARRSESKFVAGMAHNPEMLQWYLKDFYQKVFYGGNVKRRFKELGRLRLSTGHGCRSCNLGNRLDALDGGLNEAEIDNIHELEFEGFSAQDRSVLRLADLMSMGAAPGSVLEEPLFRNLRNHFSSADILELALTFSILAGIARMIFAFDFAVKEKNCRF